MTEPSLGFAFAIPVVGSYDRSLVAVVSPAVVVVRSVGRANDHPDLPEGHRVQPDSAAVVEQLVRIGIHWNVDHDTR